jgi:hypothetical protein
MLTCGTSPFISATSESHRRLGLLKCAAWTYNEAVRVLTGIGGKTAVDDIGNLVLQKMEKNYLDAQAANQGKTILIGENFGMGAQAQNVRSTLMIRSEVLKSNLTVLILLCTTLARNSYVPEN